jgi:hypothetical protein
LDGGPERTRISDLYRVKVRTSITYLRPGCVFSEIEKTDLDSIWTPRPLPSWFGLQPDSRACVTKYAMGMAVEAQMQISRFAEFEVRAPERLVVTRGRHIAGLEMVVKFRVETLDYEHVLQGGAAPLYPILMQIRNIFGQTGLVT